MNKAKASIERLNWSSARAKAHAVYPELASTIDDMDVGDFPVYRVSYPYGSSVLKDGILQIPNQSGELVSIQDSPYAKELNYTNDMPFGLVIKNALELYCIHQNKIIPWRMLYPGRISSLWNVLIPEHQSSHTGRMWQMSAGSSSLSMLPSMKRHAGLLRLKESFDLDLDITRKDLSQRELLSNITHSEAFEHDWTVEVLFFTREWVDNLRQAKGKWLLLKDFLTTKRMLDTAYLSDDVVLNYTISTALQNKNIKIEPYFIDTLKHVYNIARNIYPGFTIATTDVAGPVSRIKQVFDEIYDSDTIPTMIHPDYLERNGQTNVLYYSLQKPMLLEFYRRVKNTKSQNSDLAQFIDLHKPIRDFILTDELGLQNTPIYNIMNDICYTFLHTYNGCRNEVEHPESLTQIDQSIALENQASDDGKLFCYTSSFFRGCFCISKLGD